MILAVAVGAFPAFDDESDTVVVDAPPCAVDDDVRTGRLARPAERPGPSVTYAARIVAAAEALRGVP